MKQKSKTSYEERIPVRHLTEPKPKSINERTPITELRVSVSHHSDQKRYYMSVVPNRAEVGSPFETCVISEFEFLNLSTAPVPRFNAKTLLSLAETVKGELERKRGVSWDFVAGVIAKHELALVAASVEVAA